MAKAKNKGGRPRKMTPEKMREVLAILAVGGTRLDAAAYCGVSDQNIRDAAKWDPDFGAELEKADAAGKVHHLKRIRNAEPWQASAWYLERKYPQEWGRKERVEHSGANGGPIQTETEIKGDGLAAFVRDEQAMRQVRKIINQAAKHEDGGRLNGHLNGHAG